MPRGHKSSPFRFTTSDKTGQYGVWRGEEQLGHITKFSIPVPGTKRTVWSWTPSTLDGRDLASEETKEKAARALWEARKR